MKKQHLLLASAAVALMVAAAPAFAQVATTTVTTPVTTTTTKSTVHEQTGPLTNVTNTTIRSETVAPAEVKKTVTAVDPVNNTISTTTTTAVAPAVTAASEMNVQTTEKGIVDGKTRIFNLKEFDTNNDGLLTRAEVGEKLFKMYDADGNGVIDNIEYERPAVITVVPVEKTTVVTYDFNGDGVADQQEATSENFLRYTQLARFDQNKNGLSPREFVGRGFLEADIDGDKFVNLKEWQGSYNAAIDRSNKIQGNLNK